MLKLKTFGGLVIRRDGAAVAGAGGQRRRVILLAVLAAASERGLSRDKLLGLFWPDADPDRARKNLAQAVYALRKDLARTTSSPASWSCASIPLTSPATWPNSATP